LWRNINVFLVVKMDHEKPQAVSPLVFDFSGEMSRSTDYTDMQHGRTPSLIDIDEPEQVEERRERSGDSVWYAFHSVSALYISTYISLGEY
jgi:hypothetical protein